MKLYLEELGQKNLVKKEESKKSNLIVITKQGRDFLFKYNQMREFEKTFGL